MNIINADQSEKLTPRGSPLKVNETNTGRSATYDFLLMIHSIHAPKYMATSIENRNILLPTHI